MRFSLFHLKPLKPLFPSAFVLTLSALPPAIAQPAAATPKPLPMSVGILDEDKLALARSDFPVLASKVLPQVVAKRHLTLVITKSGVKWGGSKLASVDVTADVLALLSKLPPTLGALTGAQRAAADRIVSSLTAMRIASEVAELSEAQFLSRLTDLTIVYEANIQQVPAGALHAQIDKAMQLYSGFDATWKICIQAAEYANKTVDAEFELQREQSPPQLYAQLEVQEEAERKKRIAAIYKPLVDARDQASREVLAIAPLMAQLNTIQ